MIKVAITVQGSGTAVVARLQDQLAHPRPLHEAAAAAVCNTVQRHFLGRNSEPNKHGWPSKNFWSKEGFQKTAVAEVSDAGATVGIASPAIAHKRTGGTVTPKRGKYLAIPITAAAYLAGSPREGGMPDLFPITSRSGFSFLARREGKFGSMAPQYLLLRSVTHKPDPRTLPETSAMEQSAGKAVRTALKTFLGNN